MKERPILFNGPMVRALLAGSKTQTRRVVKPQPTGFVGGPGVTLCDGSPAPLVPMNDFAGTCGHEIICPYGQPGDRLWVREAWAASSIYDATPPSKICDHLPRPFERPPCGIAYPASGGCIGLKLRPSIHMPRWASRITLELTGVRVERLQDISRGDAMAEGCPFPNMAQGDDPRRWYAQLFDEIHGEGSVEANPWVWVVEFRSVEVAAK
jgi:hypothetical protein